MPALKLEIAKNSFIRVKIELDADYRRPERKIRGPVLIIIDLHASILD